MVSHKHKCIFVHIPKVAGQSFETLFLSDLGLNWMNRRPLILMDNPDPAVGPPKLAHLLAEDYVKYNYISQELFNGYYKFAFVRNPFDRAYSFYKFLGYSEFLSFDNFIINQFEKKLLKNYYWFIRPQYDYLYSNGKCLVNFVGKFENLKSDFKHVSLKLNLDKELPRTNISKSSSGFKRKVNLILNNFEFLPLFFTKPHSREFKLSNQAKEILTDFYINDFKYFNYNFK